MGYLLQLIFFYNERKLYLAIPGLLYIVLTGGFTYLQKDLLNLIGYQAILLAFIKKDLNNKEEIIIAFTAAFSMISFWVYGLIVSISIIILNKKIIIM